MRLKQIILILPVIILLFPGLFGSINSSSVPELPEFEPGDIVLRRGMGVVSNIALMAGKGAVYSHSGIYAEVNGKGRIVHIVPGLASGNDKVRAEPPYIFLSKKNAIDWIVMRTKKEYALSASVAAKEAAGFMEKELKFDTAFDMNDSGKIYCTELVWLAYKNAGLDLIEGKPDTLDLPLLSREFILPDRFASGKYLEKICSHSEKE